MTTKLQQEAAREELMKYLLPDCLKPEYNGESLWAIVGKVLEAAEDAGKEEMLNDMAQTIGKCPLCTPKEYGGEENSRTVDSVEGVGSEKQHG